MGVDIRVFLEYRTNSCEEWFGIEELDVPRNSTIYTALNNHSTMGLPSDVSYQIKNDRYQIRMGYNHAWCTPQAYEESINVAYRELFGYGVYDCDFKDWELCSHDVWLGIAYKARQHQICRIVFWYD